MENNFARIYFIKATFFCSSFFFNWFCIETLVKVSKWFLTGILFLKPQNFTLPNLFNIVFSHMKYNHWIINQTLMVWLMVFWRHPCKRHLGASNLRNFSFCIFWSLNLAYFMIVSFSKHLYILALQIIQNLPRLQ